LIVTGEESVIYQSNQSLVHRDAMLNTTKKVAIFLAICLFSQRSLADGSGLKISAAADMTGSFKASTKSKADDKFELREAEFMFYAPIDHLFDGVISAAAHREEGLSLFEMHEAYIQSAKLVPRSRIRIGQYFLGIGRLNQMHRHEWPTISAPLVHKQFFGEEGAADSGLEYSYLTPLPFFLEASIGTSSGWTWGHSHNEGAKPKKPTYYGRLTTYFDLPVNGGAQTGLNFLQRTPADGSKTSLLGLDLVAKWREGAALNFMLQSEAWLRTTLSSGGDKEESYGLYALPQIALSSSSDLGILLDYYSVRTLRDLSGNQIKNYQSRITPHLTIKPSEFSKFRLAYEFNQIQQANQTLAFDRTVHFQSTFLLGAHPAHEF